MNGSVDVHARCHLISYRNRTNTSYDKARTCWVRACVVPRVPCTFMAHALPPFSRCAQPSSPWSIIIVMGTLRVVNSELRLHFLRFKCPSNQLAAYRGQLQSMQHTLLLGCLQPRLIYRRCDRLYFPWILIAGWTAGSSQVLWGLPPLC